jgi:hypothetical protein
VLPNLNIFELMRKYIVNGPGKASEASIHAIDGQRVDIRLSGSSNVLRNVQVMGDPSELTVGQLVPLIWDNERPIVLALTSDGSIPVAATVVTDGATIENSAVGLRVKAGGVQPWHLSFVPSIEGHTHQDSLQMAGWRITADGAIYKGDTFIHPTGQISLGLGEQLIVLDSTDERYRLYSGASDPELAPFSVSVDGEITATAGVIGGWEIFPDRLENSNVSLDPAGWIRIGYTGLTGQDPDNSVYMTSTTDTAWEEDWAFWIGAENPDDAPFRVTKGGAAWLESAVVSVELESANYVAGQSGWKLDNVGTLEAQQAIIRGEIHSAVFVSDTTAVTAGKQFVTDGTVFVQDVQATDTSIVVSEDIFDEDDLVYTQPSYSRSEWMRVTSTSTPITGIGYEYTVTRDLDGGGANDFYAGENIHRQGAATFPDPASTWGDVQGPFGFENAWGGPGFKAMGGLLVLDGSSITGPYMAVRRRFGASYNQMSDVVRIGRLKGFLGYEIDEYGFGVGSLTSNLIFTPKDGMSLTMAEGQTVIDEQGVASERFGLYFAEDEPGYTDGMVRFWVDQSTKRVYANYKDGAYEEESVWLDFSTGGAIADNSDKVDGYHAYGTATANSLLALNIDSKLPASITGDADTVDGYHASSFSLTSHLHDDRYYTETESDAKYLPLAGGTMTGQLNITDLVKIAYGSSFIRGNTSLGQITVSGSSRIRLGIGEAEHLEIESGNLYSYGHFNIMDGNDLIVYSDSGMTEVARIDGDTGYFNGVDIGALDDDDGADIIGYRDSYSVGWMVDTMAGMAMLVVPTVDVDTSLNIGWGEGVFIDAGVISDTLSGDDTLTDDDINYLVWGESTDQTELTVVLTHDPDTQVLVATIECVSGVGTVTMAPTFDIMARDAWYTASDAAADIAALASSGGPSVHWDNITNAPTSEWELGTDNFLTPTSAGAGIRIDGIEISEESEAHIRWFDCDWGTGFGADVVLSVDTVSPNRRSHMAVYLTSEGSGNSIWELYASNYDNSINTSLYQNETMYGWYLYNGDGSHTLLEMSAGYITFNESGHDVDFRVEGSDVDTIYSDGARNVVQVQNWLELPDVTTANLPGTGDPPSGWGAVFVDSGKLYFRDDSLVDYDLTAGCEWTLDTSGFLLPNSETTQVVIGATEGSGAEILQVTGNTILSGDLTVSGGTIDIDGDPITVVSAQILLQAAGGIPKTTGGCSASTQIEFVTNLENFAVIDFDSVSQEYADWSFVLPSDYDGGTMVARFIWKENSGATAHDVVWGIRGICYADDDAFDQAQGTAEEVVASAGNAADVYFSGDTDPITWAGSPEGGQLIHITVYRDPTNTSDTLDTDARLLAVQLDYTRTY